MNFFHPRLTKRILHTKRTSPTLRDSLLIRFYEPKIWTVSCRETTLWHKRHQRTIPLTIWSHTFTSIIASTSTSTKWFFSQKSTAFVGCKSYYKCPSFLRVKKEGRGWAILGEGGKVDKARRVLKWLKYSSILKCHKVQLMKVFPRRKSVSGKCLG